MTRTYKNAPLNEVVISAAIPPLLELLPQHVGLFWSEIRHEFPVCQQHPTVGLPIESPGDFFPLPRFWFLSADEAEVLQLQRDRFTVNWRRRGDADYPHFEAIKRRFAWYHERLRQFAVKELDTEFPDSNALEVTYINVLDPSLGWQGMQSLGELLPGFSPPTLAKSLALESLNIVLAARETQSQDVVFITSRSGNSPSGDPVLILEIKVSSKDVVRTPVDAMQWIGGAHYCVNATFDAITSEDVQNRVWLKRPSKNV